MTMQGGTEIKVYGETVELNDVTRNIVPQIKFVLYHDGIDITVGHEHYSTVVNVSWDDFDHLVNAVRGLISAMRAE